MYHHASIALAAGLLYGAGAWAADNIEQVLGQKLKKFMPDVEISSVSASPLPGVYEVVIGASLIYMSEDGRFVFRGDLIDITERRNLSDEKRTAARMQAFAQIGADEAIEFAPKSKKVAHTLYVYTDIDCGYCRKLHREVAQLNDAGIAVRYLAFPRTGMNSESSKKAAAVWCSDNQQQAMTAAKAGKEVTAKACSNPVEAHFTLGKSMGVRGTPSVYTEQGESLGGYIPAPELIKMLSGENI